MRSHHHCHRLTIARPPNLRSAMNAKYAFHLTRLFTTLRAVDTEPALKQLYLYVYPQIYEAIKRGQTNTLLNVRPAQATIDLLTKDGFMVSSLNGERYTVDWRPAARSQEPEFSLDC